MTVPSVVGGDLVDTSAWIEFLRGTASATCDAVERLVAQGHRSFFTCHPVRMEVLAGARDDGHLSKLRGLLERGDVLSMADVDYEEAAAIYRRCRRGGATPRAMIDCLIAAVAIRSDAVLLHNDRDFDTIARYSDLRARTT